MGRPDCAMATIRTNKVIKKAPIAVKKILSRAKSACTRFKQGKGTHHISEAINLDRQALDLCPTGHRGRWNSLALLANHLKLRYDQLGEMQDIEEAIAVSREALDLCPERHPIRSRLLNNASIHLSDRYNRLGVITDLNEAIIVGRQALDLRPPGHQDRSASLNNVALCLFDRYKQLGDMKGLNEAIIIGRQALDLCPPSHPLRSTLLNNIALHFFQRSVWLGAMTDLDKAIILGRQALDLRPPGHRNRAASLNNVALYLSDRYKRLGDITDLNAAIILGKQALDLRPKRDPNRSLSLDNVAHFLSDRYNRLGELTDLNEAILLGRQALDDRPPGHLGRPTTLNNLATCLSGRFDRLGEMADINEAVILSRQALDLRPSGHPDRSHSLNQLACCLRVRFIHSTGPKDTEDLFSLYTQLKNVQQMVSSSDLSAAKKWIRVAEEFHHPTILLAYETSLRLLVQHLATLPSLPHHLQIFKDLSSSLAVDAFSTCLRSQCTEKAVELLEQGRGVFWNQIARLRSPLEDVIASGQAGEALANEFTRLASQIRSTLDSHCHPDQHDRLCGLNFDLQSAITKIRKLPGLSCFLLPSSFSDLQSAASGGPVIIVNASQYTCDALVVFFDRDPAHIPLQVDKSRVQGLSSELRSLTLRAEMMDVKNDLGRFLRDLWDEVVSPIVDFLQTTVPLGSRIWWCPTAEFSLLPLHAAGPYRKGQWNLSHLYISSYTPTLTALIRARRNDPLAKSLVNVNRFLAVGQANANGQSKLPSVGSELDIVAESMQGLATLTRLEGSESNVSRVSEDLGKAEWVHFACHGIPNEENPFESAFALHDGLFTIERIIGCELEHPQFAYLSACHTTVGYKESPDEVIHLASAMQFAGFRSVIGTMWAVDDAHTEKITSTFYGHMLDGSGCLDHTRAALALNKTMNSLADVPLDQRILYVHIGA